MVDIFFINYQMNNITNTVKLPLKDTSKYQKLPTRRLFQNIKYSKSEE